MRLKSLSFRNFRNLHDAQVVDIPDAPLLVAAAPNATGKTNFLEAISILLRGKSFRASHEECVAWGEDFFLVQGGVDGREGVAQLSVQYHTLSRKLRIEQDTNPISPILLYSNYPFVLFLPDDTFLFHRGPALRRNFLNNALTTSTQYVSALVQYHRALRQRNAALKGATSLEDTSAWTSVLVEHAAIIWAQREALAQYLNNHVAGMLGTLLQIPGELSIQLSKGVPDGDDFQQALEGAWAQERRYGYTVYGPHRDDLEVAVDGRSVRSALSRGQIRALVISLKVVVYQFMKQVGGIAPLLLFDEVLSELDPHKQKRLFDSLPSSQVLLTCTDLPKGVRQRSDVYLLDIRELTEVKKQTMPASQVLVTEEMRTPA